MLNHRQGGSCVTSYQQTTRETGGKEELGFGLAKADLFFQVQSREVGNIHLYTPILICQVSQLKSPCLNFWEDQEKSNKPPPELQQRRDRNRNQNLCDLTEADQAH